ncbi:MAG: ATP-binding protein [Desertifilum sp. SIO1I2]|nr:ATP-binding protein [Desertifilum sp. SIO1I2]
MLSREFLLQIARTQELSRKQEEVLLARFAEELDYEQMGEQLETSAGACLKRMGEIYKKFGITGERRGKENRLRICLLNYWDERRRSEPEPPAELELEPLDFVQPEIAIFHPYQNLPAPSHTVFVGREAEISRLLELLSPNHSAHLISIDGLGGVGKSTLALEAAYRCLQASRIPEALPNVPRFEAIIFTSAKQTHLTPGGLLHRLRREHTLQAICQEIARTLEFREITHSEPGEQLERTRDCLARLSTLLIVDNLETLEDRQDVLSFLYDLPANVKVIVTTREQAMFVPIRLTAFASSDAEQFIQYQSQERGVELDSSEIRALAQKTSGIPAAMVYAIGQLASGYLLPDVLQRIDNAQGDIAQFCFAGSVESLRDRPAHRLLMALAMFGAPALREAIATVAFPLPDAIATADGLAQLQQLSLVQSVRGRYQLLALTREYVLGELAAYAPGDFPAQARQRWLEFYQDFAKRYAEKDWQEWHSPSELLDREWENLKAAIDWCIAQEQYEPVWELWQKVKGYALVQGYWDDRLIWTSWLMQRTEQRGDWSNLSELLLERAKTLTLMGRTAQLGEATTLLEKAWRLRDYQNSIFQCRLMSAIAVLQIRLNCFDIAQDWLNRQRQLLQETTLDPAQMQRLWIHLHYYEAEVCYQLGEYQSAKRLYQQALKSAQQIGWRRCEIYIQHWLAEVAIALLELPKATALLEEGLPIAEAQGDRRCMAYYYRALAMLAHLQQQEERSHHWANLALSTFDRLGMLPEAEEMQARLHKYTKKEA